MAHDKNGDYEVGYGKPPKATRFGARPQPARANRRTSRSQNPDIAALLDRPIEALIGGKKAKLHPHEAMLHGLFQRSDLVFLRGALRDQGLLRYQSVGYFTK